MRTADVIVLSFRSFRTRPLRTLLTIMGMGIGIGAVLFLVAIGYGLQQTILDRIATADTLLTLGVRPGGDDLPLTDESVAAFIAQGNIAEVARSASVSANATIGTLTTSSALAAVDPSFFRLNGAKLTAGSLFDASSLHAVVSTAGAALFGASPQDILGREVTFSIIRRETSDEEGASGRPTILGPFAIGGVVDEGNKSRFYLPFPMVDGVLSGRFAEVKVRVTGNAVMADVRQRIVAQGYVVSALSDTIAQANTVFRAVQGVLGLFGIIALLVSAIGMFNTMTISLLERTQEIGIMRAIGLTRRDVRRMFLIESMLMGAFGGVMGIAIGFTLGMLMDFGINALASRFGAPSIQLFLAPTWFVLIIFTFSSVIGFLTGLYPSIRASRLNPLDALQYK